MTTPTFREFTGTAAENYERFFVPAIATPVAEYLLRAAAIQPGERVLDVACGTGVIARLAASSVGTGGSVTGVDVAPEMIEVARGTTAADGADVEWHVADAADLPFPDGAYDLVVCQMGLMFMPDPLGALREMRRVLAPDGRIVVSTPGAIQPLFEILERAIVDQIAPELGGFVGAVFSMSDADRLAALLADAGFADASATVTSARLVLPPPGEFLWQYINLTPLGSFVADAPADALAALERQMVDGARDLVVDGQVSMDQPIVVARARRSDL